LSFLTKRIMLQEINHNILILLSQGAPKIKWRRGHYIHNHFVDPQRKP
ncbi:TPA: hypothetical protein G9C67_004582, partial [Salmonella enterica]|nr:hypothetical protein [Salmonella enterica]